MSAEMRTPEAVTIPPIPRPCIGCGATEAQQHIDDCPEVRAAVERAGHPLAAETSQPHIDDAYTDGDLRDAEIAIGLHGIDDSCSLCVDRGCACPKHAARAALDAVASAIAARALREFATDRVTTQTAARMREDLCDYADELDPPVTPGHTASETHWQRLHRCVEARRRDLGLTQDALQAAGGPSPRWVQKLRDLTGPPTDRMRRPMRRLDQALGWDVDTAWRIARGERTEAGR